MLPNREIVETSGKTNVNAVNNYVNPILLGRDDGRQKKERHRIIPSPPRYSEILWKIVPRRLFIEASRGKQFSTLLVIYHAFYLLIILK